jgi:outer membrane scaffolding protein for murein synthesis (MipA/OmpV family)
MNRVPNWRHAGIAGAFVVVVGCVAGVPAWGQAAGPSTEAAPAAAEPAPQPPRERPRRFEGAAGLILAYRPAFSGSSDRQVKPELAGFLRWGRITVSGAGGFTTKAQDDVERGLDALLIKRERLRVNLALRFDPGRQESDSDDLAGMGDIRATVRARLALRWEPAPLWAVGLSSSFDALNRVGGYMVSGSVSRRFDLGPRQRLFLSASLTGAGDRYMQTWYGVTPAQSTASGYAVYDAPEGLRDLSLSATWRTDFDEHWAGFASLGATRLLGPAADSPLVRQRNGAGLSFGLARRF